jgi:hypothetical protein
MKGPDRVVYGPLGQPRLVAPAARDARFRGDRRDGRLLDDSANRLVNGPDIALTAQSNPLRRGPTR